MASTGASGPLPRLSRIEGELVRAGRDHLATGRAVPDRKGQAEVALARDAPVPAQVLHPRAVPRSHGTRVPRDALAGLKQRIFGVQHTDKPLARHDVLDRRIAALMQAHRLDDGLLAENRAPGLQGLEDAASRFW